MNSLVFFLIFFLRSLFHVFNLWSKKYTFAKKNMQAISYHISFHSVKQKIYLDIQIICMLFINYHICFECFSSRINTDLMMIIIGLFLYLHLWRNKKQLEKKLKCTKMRQIFEYLFIYDNELSTGDHHFYVSKNLCLCYNFLQNLELQTG